MKANIVILCRRPPGRSGTRDRSRDLV